MQWNSLSSWFLPAASLLNPFSSEESHGENARPSKSCSPFCQEWPALMLHMLSEQTGYIHSLQHAVK